MEIEKIQVLFTNNMQTKNLKKLYFSSIFSFKTQFLLSLFKLFIISSDFTSLQISVKIFIH